MSTRECDLSVSAGTSPQPRKTTELQAIPSNAGFYANDPPLEPQHSGCMRAPQPLPNTLPRVFTTSDAFTAGVSRARLRHETLERPFHGVRAQPADWAFTEDPWQRQAEQHRIRALEYAPRLREATYFSHETAAVLWGAPLPYVSRDGIALDGRALPVHVSVLGTGPLPRGKGVHGHRADPRTSGFVAADGIRVADPATTWANLGHLPLYDLVAIGDYMCRKWREGVGRPTPGRAPLATIDELRRIIAAGRREGGPRLRTAVELIREDSWSPKESLVRCILVDAGLPEPRLNEDVYADNGAFLGCLDLAYVFKKVGVEYNGVLHAKQYARDVERIAALRASGWIIIEVTAELLRNPAELVARVRRALASR